MGAQGIPGRGSRSAQGQGAGGKRQGLPLLRWPAGLPPDGRRAVNLAAVGAVAVHGYAGFLGVCIAGFMLWGYPSSPFEGYAPITPWGQFIGAIIMFFVLGFIPAWIMSKILNGMGMLRIPREIEMVGLDINFEDQREADARDLREAIRSEA